MLLTNGRPISTLLGATITRNTLVFLSDGIDIDPDGMVTPEGDLVHTLERPPISWRPHLPGRVKFEEPKYDQRTLDMVNGLLDTLGIEVDDIENPRLRVQGKAWQARYFMQQGESAETTAHMMDIDKQEVHKLSLLGLQGQQIIDRLRRK